ncbi:MAG: class I SAM-dependent methyltransferase [Desulfobacterales bacterium]|nr:class I SAM-dependent methyltransferase [Desulfobacterales bacterium]
MSFFTRYSSTFPARDPGCTGATRKAFSYLPPLPKDADVLDIGCGSGTQTRDLAALTSGTITAVDNHQPFLDCSQQKGTRGRCMAGRIKTVCASMDSLPFDPGQFDLIWSEGAIFIMGFDKGLAAWKPLLKNGGYMVVSDAAWFEPNPPRGTGRSGGRRRGIFPKQRIKLREQVKNAGFSLISNIPAARSRLVG